MGKYSLYAIPENELPKWHPGEDLAAAAFVGMAMFIVVDVNVGIWRVFRKRQGLYYWAMLLGTFACLVDAIGVILKFLTPSAHHVWGLYTALLLVGWSIYAPAQLLVLYSRLHLINDNRRTQRWVLIMILSTIFFLIIPTWVVVWPAYDTDPKISALWSPRDAIVERYNQIGFTLVEVILSGIYIWSLLGLLNLKASVRQRRVMLDLIYVNVIIVSLDLLVVILLYLNQTGISHPIQTFSYAIKLKLEFVVLNQLMAVAARGVQRENFEERRYHHSSAADAFSAECRRWDGKASDEPQRKSLRQRQGSSCPQDSVQLTLPSPTMSEQDHSWRYHACKDRALAPIPHQNTVSGRTAEHQDETHDHEKSDEDMRLDDFLDDDSAASDMIRHKPSEAFSGETLRAPEAAPIETTPRPYPRQARDMKNQAPRSMHNPFTGHGRNYDQPDRRQQRKMPHIATLKRRVPKNGRDCSYEDEQEEIGVHMWENRKGSLVMEVPWFNSRNEA